MNLQKKHLILMMATLLTIGCTIVKHDDENKKQDDGLTFYFENGSFDAAAYVADIWDSQVLPKFIQESYPLNDVLNALDQDVDEAGARYGRKAEVESPYTFRVAGSAEIIAANTGSAASTVELRTAGYNGQKTILMQIGPVIKTSTVRDSLGFISFGDFTNQLEYAGVSKELNFKVRDEVVSGLNRDALVGAQVSFSGAFTLDTDSEVLITPVILEIVYPEEG